MIEIKPVEKSNKTTGDNHDSNNHGYNICIIFMDGNQYTATGNGVRRGGNSQFLICADQNAKEKNDAYDTAKKEHDDAESGLNKAQAELTAAQTAASTSPCTTVGGNPGYWSNTAGTPAPTITTAPKSLRAVHGQ